MSSLRRHEGYLLIDHRNSPGITEADLLTLPARMRSEFEPRKGLFESPTLRCAHCGTMVILNPNRTRARNYCAPCDHYVCDGYACLQSCTPFTKAVDDTLNAGAHQQAIQEV